MSSPFYKYLNDFATINVSYIGMSLITGYTKQDIKFSVDEKAKIIHSNDIVAKIPESLAWLLDDIKDNEILGGNMYKNFMMYKDIDDISKIPITNVLQLYVALNYDISDFRFEPSWKQWLSDIVSNLYIRRISGDIKVQQITTTGI